MRSPRPVYAYIYSPRYVIVCHCREISRNAGARENNWRFCPDFVPKIAKIHVIEFVIFKLCAERWIQYFEISVQGWFSLWETISVRPASSLTVCFLIMCQSWTLVPSGLIKQFMEALVKVVFRGFRPPPSPCSFRGGRFVVVVSFDARFRCAGLLMMGVENRVSLT